MLGSTPSHDANLTQFVSHQANDDEDASSEYTTTLDDLLGDYWDPGEAAPAEDFP